MLAAGDGAPHFRVASNVNPNFNFDTVAGRYIVLSFFGTTQHPAAKALLDEIDRRAAHRFDVTNFAFFGVTTDPEDVARLPDRGCNQTWFYDFDLAVSRKFGLVREETAADGTTSRRYVATTFVLDQALRILASIALTDDPVSQVDTILNVLDQVPPLNKLPLMPPVLVVPYVFEPDFCRALIDYYEAKGGEDSGFMRDVNGKTVGVMDYSHKRRMDCVIEDHRLIQVAHNRIRRRVVPAIKQAYQFDVTRIERNIVACYDAAQGAHFRAHRDNTTLGTAHRRFAVTINLNSSEYEGGEIWFPEFGPRRYKAPSGAAIIFSCSLLHEVPPVTRGKRYAFLPFLYDEAAAAVREQNRKHLGDISGARSQQPAECNATRTADAPSQPSAGQSKLPILDGTCGCGNPNGCQTCLSAPAYSLGER